MVFAKETDRTVIPALDVDNPYHIRLHLSTLDDLNSLVNQRREAGYKAERQLTNYVILGRLVMDACGNTSRIFEGGPKTPEKAYPIIPIGQFNQKAYPDLEWLDDRFSHSYDKALPTATEACGVCDRTWSISDWWDSLFVEQKGYHPRCYQSLLNISEEATVRTALTAAGWEYFAKLVQIPNQYWGRATRPVVPWFRIETTSGVLIVGCRKRVWNIDWTGLNCSREPDFSQEDVTKERTMIHAWGIEKLVEYLREIRECRAKPA